MELTAQTQLQLQLQLAASATITTVSAADKHGLCNSIICLCHLYNVRTPTGVPCTVYHHHPPSLRLRAHRKLSARAKQTTPTSELKKFEFVTVPLDSIDWLQTFFQTLYTWQRINATHKLSAPQKQSSLPQSNGPSLTCVGHLFRVFPSFSCD